MHSQRRNRIVKNGNQNTATNTLVSYLGNFSSIVPKKLFGHQWSGFWGKYLHGISLEAVTLSNYIDPAIWASPMVVVLIDFSVHKCAVECTAWQRHYAGGQYHQGQIPSWWEISSNIRQATGQHGTNGNSIAAEIQAWQAIPSTCIQYTMYVNTAACIYCEY